MKEERDILKEHVIKDFSQTTPSTDFTDLVMHKIEVSLTTKTIVAPLIPKSFWKYIILGAVLIIALSFLIEMPKSNLNWLDKISIELPNLSSYKTTIKTFFSMLFIISTLSLVDFFYRKYKTNV